MLLIYIDCFLCLDSHLAHNRTEENCNSVMKDHFYRLFLFFFLAFFFFGGGGGDELNSAPLVSTRQGLGQIIFSVLHWELWSFVFIIGSSWKSQFCRRVVAFLVRLSHCAFCI